MHPLHDYIARQVSERLKDHRIVVMYDPRKRAADVLRRGLRRRHCPDADGHFRRSKGDRLLVPGLVPGGPLRGGAAHRRRGRRRYRRLRARHDKGREDVASAGNRKGRRLLPAAGREADGAERASKALHRRRHRRDARQRQAHLCRPRADDRGHGGGRRRLAAEEHLRRHRYPRDDRQLDCGRKPRRRDRSEGRRRRTAAHSASPARIGDARGDGARQDACGGGAIRSRQ